MDVAASMHAAVQQMRRGSSRMAQLQAANRLSDLFEHTILREERFAPLQAAFAAAGGNEAAVQLLQSATPALQRATACVLRGACLRNEQCAAAVASAGGVSALLRLLRVEAQSSAQPKEQHLYLACALGQAAAASRAAAQAAADAGGGQLAMELLQAAPRRSEARWWLPMAQTLVAIARLGEVHAADLAERGAIEELVQRLPRPPAGETAGAAPVTVICALCWLSKGSKVRAAAVADAGVVPALLHCLSSNGIDTQAHASQLLAAVLIARPHLRASAIEAGGDSQLRRLLSSSGAEVRQKQLMLLVPWRERTINRQLPSQLLEVAALQLAHRRTPPAHPASVPRLTAAPPAASGCGAVRYCSAECSRTHWREHRAECRRLQVQRAPAPAAVQASAEAAV